MGVMVRAVVIHLEDDGQFRVQYTDDQTIESHVDPWKIMLYDDYTAMFKVGETIWVNWLELGIWWTALITDANPDGTFQVIMNEDHLTATRVLPQNMERVYQGWMADYVGGDA